MKTDGIAKNIPFFFTNTITAIYCLITPAYFYFSGRKTVWGDEFPYRGKGVDITDYYVYGFLAYFLGLLGLSIGYYLFSKKRRQKIATLTSSLSFVGHSKLVALFAFSLFVVVYSIFAGGINIYSLLLGVSDMVIKGHKEDINYYLFNFSDTIITVLIIMYYFKTNKIILIGAVLLSWFLFSLMGLRYKIILTIVGFLFAYIVKNKVFVKQVTLLGSILVVILYFMLFLAVNKAPLISGDIDNLEYSPSAFEYNILFEQTRGGLADINVIEHYIRDGEQHDYGISFLMTFVRVLPPQIVGRELKQRLYSYNLAFKVIPDAYQLPPNWGSSGEALLHYGYFYISFGMYGVFGISFLLGLFLKFFKHVFYPITDRNVIIQIVLACALFQWLTRGYFPQFVDTWAYMSLAVPLVFLRKIKWLS